MSDAQHFLFGVTVLPEYVQSEGAHSVLDRLQAAGVNAVTTSPYVMQASDQRSGSREPPIDAGAGSVRLLDRPLWGQRELWVSTAPSFAAQRERYAGLKYQPPEPTDLTRRAGEVVRQFLAAARRRGMKTYFQVQAAIPPGYRVQFGGADPDDLPRLPDGHVPAARVANNGSLASPHILEYGEAMLADLCQQYPELDGIRVDWPEYPPYSLDDMFVDFSPHAAHAAHMFGIDFDRMRLDTQRFYDRLHGGLTEHWLERWKGAATRPLAIADLLGELPGVLELSRLKSRLTEQLLVRYRKAMDDAGARHVELVANLFPWPWSLASGAGTYRLAAAPCAALLIKLYGMHWKMMVRFYLDRLHRQNTGLDPRQILAALLALLDVVDPAAAYEPADFSYPGPDEPHAISDAAQLRKIELAQAGAGQTPVMVLAHAYGPLEDFRHRMQIARQASTHGVWINRYAYLSDEKLAAL